MKKFKLIFIIVLVATTFVMCNKDEINVAPGITAAEVNNAFIDGNWRVTSFNEAGEDHTSNLSGYNFTFKDNGNILSALDTIGKWSTTPESDIAIMMLDFTRDSIKTDIDSIGKNWSILALTPQFVPTKIEMKRVDEDDASIDFLTFEKF